MALLDDQERYLDHRLKRANFPPLGLHVLSTDGDDWLRALPDGANLRDNPGLLASRLCDLPRRREWSLAPAMVASLSPLVQQGDLYAVMLASLLRDLLDEAASDELTRAGERLETEAPLAWAAFGIFDPARFRLALSWIARHRPPPLLLAMVQLLPLVLRLFPGRFLERADLVRLLLAMEEYGLDGVMHLLAHHSPRRCAFREHLMLGLLIDLLPSAEFRALLNMYGKEHGSAAHLPLRLKLCAAMRQCRRQDLTLRLTWWILQLDDRWAQAALAEVLHGRPQRASQLALPMDLLEPALKLLNTSWIPAPVKRELLGGALCSSAEGQMRVQVLDRLLAGMPRTVAMERMLLEAVLDRCEQQSLPSEAELDRLRPLVFVALDRVLSADLPALVGRLTGVVLRHQPWCQELEQALDHSLLSHPDPAVVLAALDACGRLHSERLLSRVREISDHADAEVALAAQQVVLGMEGHEAWIRRAQDLLSDPQRHAAEVGAERVVSTIVQTLTSLAPSWPEATAALRVQAATTLARHGSLLLGPLTNLTLGDREARRLLQQMIQGVDHSARLGEVLEGLCPLLGVPHLRPQVIKLLSHLPQLGDLVQPEHELLLLQSMHLLHLQPVETMEPLWARLGRPRAVGCWGSFLEQNPGQLVETFDAGVLSDYACWLLERDGAVWWTARALALLEALVFDDDQQLDQHQQRALLSTLMRQLELTGEDTHGRILRLAERVRQRVLGADAGAGPYRGDASAEIKLLDRKLERARQTRGLDRVAPVMLQRQLEDALGRGESALIWLLREWEEQRQLQAISALVEVLQTAVDEGLAQHLENTLRILCKMQSQVEAPICLACVERFERRRYKSGLLSRVRYRACKRCGNSGDYLPDVQHITLVVCGQQSDDWYRLKGDLLKLDWRQCALRGRQVSTFDDVRLLDHTWHTVQWFLSWYRQAHFSFDRDRVRPLLQGADASLSRELQAALEIDFDVI